MRIYLDSAPIIYLVEAVAPYAALLETRLSESGTLQVCSDLTRLECRVKPLQEGQLDLLAAFDRYLAEIIVEIVPLSRIVIDRATELRARYGFRTPDALHLAAAIVGDCDFFLTNDRRLCRCTEIPVESIEP
jgi:predicted nucleic acid-binding protein